MRRFPPALALLALLPAVAGAEPPRAGAAPTMPERAEPDAAAPPAGELVLPAAEDAALDEAVRRLQEQAGETGSLTEAQLRAYPDARGMPADVQAFIVRWQDCNHWLGEPAWDEARARDIAEAVAETCPGIDALGREVRARHAANPAVLARLADYGETGQ